MKVLLVNVDSKIPNLALMKISAYHKSIGDEVGFNVTDPDKIYASVVFNKNRHLVDGLHYWYPDAEIDIGGSGYSLSKRLPQEIDCMTPDYSIYPTCDSFYGFTTRGCIRNCYFCIVHKKEGKFHRLYDTQRDALAGLGVDDRFDRITFLDNNILADKDWFMELTDGLTQKIDFNQGLDARLLDSEIATRLSELTPISCWKFAFDSMSVKDDVLNAIQLLNDAGISTRSKVMFYVYCHDDQQVNDAVERCNILKANNTTAYAMLNQDTHQTVRMKALKRWTRPYIFWSIDFKEYSTICKKELAEGIE